MMRAPGLSTAVEPVVEPAESPERDFIAWSLLFLRFLANNHVAPFVGLGVGLLVGHFITFSEKTKGLLSLPEYLMWHMIRSLIILSVATDVTRGTLVMSSKITGKKSVRAAWYFVFIVLLAVATGLALMVVLNPGKGPMSHPKGDFVSLMGLRDIIHNMIPTDVIMSFEQVKVSKKKTHHSLDKATGKMITEIEYDETSLERPNFLYLVTSSFVFASAMACLKGRNTTFIRLNIGFHGTLTFVASLFLSFSRRLLIPFVILNQSVLIFNWQTGFKVVKFAGAISLAVLMYGAILLPTLYLLLVRHNPKGVIKEAIMAIWSQLFHSTEGPRSPSTPQRAALNRVQNGDLDFMLTWCNTGGTALILAMIVAFTVQMNKIYLDLPLLINIGFAAAVVSCGVKQYNSGFVLMGYGIVITLGSDLNEAAILLVMDWPLKHIHTAVNIFEELIGVAVLGKIFKSELQKEQQQQQG